MEAPKLEDVASIVADPKRYAELLYTPLPEAYHELERRRRDARLEEKVLKLLGGSVPEPLRMKPKAVLSRSIMSPNIEVRRFANLVEEFGKLEPLYWEYLADKFTSNNELKRMLGKLYFFDGRGRNNGAKIGLLSVIDFTAADGRPFSSVKTTWGQQFVEFHHGLFDERHQKLSPTFFDSSSWLSAQGKTAPQYYRAFLGLFVRHGILFENVMLNEQEIHFTTHVFLPTFLSLYRELGVKPLIVPLVPMDDEGNRIWMCYPGTDKEHVEQKMRRGRQA